jgi:hypothetical protein
VACDLILFVASRLIGIKQSAGPYTETHFPGCQSARKYAEARRADQAQRSSPSRAPRRIWLV